MNKIKTNKNLQVISIVAGFAIICIVYAFFIQSPSEIFEGLKTIIKSKCALVTDYYEIGGMGATLVNVGLITLICLVLHRIAKAEWNGFSVAVFFIVAGFAFFGKNLANIWPILLGNFLYAKIFKVKYGDAVKIGMLTTSLAPLVTESYFVLPTNIIALNLLFALFIGIVVGIITPMVAKYTVKCHLGLQLYNVGFAAGIVGMAFIAIYNYSNYNVVSSSVCSDRYTTETIIFSLIVMAYFLILSLIIDHKAYKRLIPLVRRQTQYGCDYVNGYGVATTLLNMTILFAFYTALVPLFGAPLSGAAIGAIHAVFGFAAFGKNLFNTIFIMLGILFLTLLEHGDLTDIRVILAILFGTSLAPIVNRYGPFFGLLAGALHVCLVRNVSGLHGGLNLYNNGFSAGLVCIFFIPICETLLARFPKAICFLNIKYLDETTQKPFVIEVKEKLVNVN